MNSSRDKIFYLLNRPKFILGLLRAQVFLRFFFGKMGRGTIIVAPELITNPSRIFVGTNVIIHSFARILCFTDFKGRRYEPSIHIGDGVKIQQGLHMSCATRIIIRNNVTVGQNVGIFDIDHQYDDVSRPIHAQPIRTQEIIIGENSFIGKGAVIMGGTRIGKNSIVGANSVVRGEFPDFCVISGSPARVLKKYNPEKGAFEKTT